jgi:hypothetical protein
MTPPRSSTHSTVISAGRGPLDGWDDRPTRAIRHPHRVRSLTCISSTPPRTSAIPRR